MHHDVIIIGGSFAGFSAAMQLARAHRSVLVIDAGAPRNRFTHASHGFLGQDGRTPAQIQAVIRTELTAYPTLRFLDGKAVAARPQPEVEGFEVVLADGSVAGAKRLILTTGVRDLLPDLPGLAERWGVSVLHCPYCHGFELNQRPVGVLARNEMAFHQAMLLPDWGPTTLFTQEAMTVTDEQSTQLAGRGVTIEHSPVEALLGPAPTLDGVRLRDGRTLPIAGLFLAPLTVPASPIAEMLGCAMSEGPTGRLVTVDAQQRTSVPGVFAAGDLTNPMANATLSAAAGVMAGAGTHRSLIFDTMTS